MSATHLDQSKLREDEKPVVSFLESLPSTIDLDTMMEEIDDVIEEIPKIKLGICAMNKKTNSQPMQEILSRISRFDFVETIIFADDVIKHEPVEKWPICDALISFYSTGFPLSKAITYAELHKPFVLNDLEMQFTLKDRCAVYNLLESANIEMPRYAILLRDDNGNPIDTDFVELEDSVQIGNIVFQKPFVEKPIDAEDHNVFIYFPSSAGGGSQRLFRKVGSRSSIYSAESSVRQYGSYIYEDFVHTDGTDVKIYTVGPEYAHAEARKSPSLDGKVERDSQGKEIRYPVILNPYEKEIAHKVCKLFKQTVCGFDLLRTHGKSFVCDVNGFSFVKTSKKYYDDCAQVLVSIVLQQLAPQLYKPYEIEADSEDRPMPDALEGNMLELRCVVGIIRHGDRTPKQKLKMEVRHPKFIELFKKYSQSTKKKLKLKQPKQLQEILDITRSLLDDMDQGKTMFEKSHKIHQLKNVLEMYGHFSGINRKIQLKYLGYVRDNTDTTSGGEDDEEALLLIMKWGGELTQAGKVQAEDLGRAFSSFYSMRGQRPKHIPCMYPGGDGAYSAIPGCGLLRLHSTYRHDLKIYASDEGRVQMTAGAFAKGFLALEGELTPILVHLVRSDKNTTEMLDTSDQATKFMNKVKHKLHDLMQIDRDFTEEDFHKLAPTQAESLVSAMKEVKNPRQMCTKLSGLVHCLTLKLKELMNSSSYNPRDPFLYHDETLELMTHRWNKLDKDFKLKSGIYDISLIPDIYDSIKYDLQHNSMLNLPNTQELYHCAKALADIVIPQEYGLNENEKVKISKTICQRLLRKIQGDLTHVDVTETFTRLNPKYSQSVISPHRHVRTRLYFTSESHVHSVINALRFGNLFEDETLDMQWKQAVDFLGEVTELNYMTQIILMLYEDPTADLDSHRRFHIEVHFSPGAKTLDKASSCQERGKSAEHKKSRPLNHSPTDTQPVDKPEQDEDTNHDERHERGISSPVDMDQHSTMAKPTEEKAPEQELQDSIDRRKPSSSSPKDVPNSKDKILSDSYEATETGNEHSRCSIGMEGFDYSPGSPIQVESLQDSPKDDLHLKQTWRRKSPIAEVNDLESGKFGRTKSESDVEVPCEFDPLRRPLRHQSEGSVYPEIATTPPASKPSEDATQQHSAENMDDPVLSRRRSISVSYLDETPDLKEHSVNNALEQSQTVVECSQRTNALDLQFSSGYTMPTAVKSDSIVLESRHSPPEKTRPSSSPTTKKTRKTRFSTGTLFYLPAIRQVTKKLSMQVHGAFRFRPPMILSNSTKPPVAEFYDNALSPVSSIHPLLTLHNDTSLPTMDRFLTRMTAEENSESDRSSTSTPATTPTRKSKHKKLSLKPTTQQELHNDSIVSLGLD